jgi:hypothetical protein
VIDRAILIPLPTHCTLVGTTTDNLMATRQLYNTFFVLLGSLILVHRSPQQEHPLDVPYSSKEITLA